MHSLFSYRRLLANALGNKLFQSLALFAVIFGHVYWLTPISASVSLTVADKSGLLTISADDKTLITAGEGNAFSHQGSFGLGLSLDAKSYVGPIHVWDMERGKERFSVAHDWTSIDTILLSPDGQILTAHQNGDLKMWDSVTGRELATVRTGAPFVELCFTPDSTLLAIRNAGKVSGGDEVITFLDTQSQQQRGKIEGDYETMAFSPDGKSVATATQISGATVKRVRQWKMGLDELPILVIDIRIPANEVVFAPDLKTFASVKVQNGTKPAEISLWNMTTGTKRWSFGYREDISRKRSGDNTTPQDRPVELAFAGNGKLLIAHEEDVFLRSKSTVWDVTAEPNEISTLNGAKPCISSDGVWLAMAKEKGADLIKLDPVQTYADLTNSVDFNDSRLGWSMDPHNNPPAATFSSDCKTVAVGPFHTFKSRPNIGSWLPQWIEPFVGDSFTSFFRLWDPATAKELFAFNHCSQLVFSPDGKMLATLQDHNTINLWRLPLCKPMARILAATILIWAFAMAAWLGITAMQRRGANTPA